MKNIACNLIYNNGGEGIFVGFGQRCDIQNIIYNVELDKGRWCSQPECSCRKFYNRGFKGVVEPYPCNESSLFVDWEWNPGNEFKTGEPFRILKSGAGKIAILTTRFANCTESERKIVGFLKIKNIINNYRVIAMRKESLRLTMDEAQELNFWNYHKNTDSFIPMWRQGRFRYLEDVQVAAILHDLKMTVQNESKQSMISGILNRDFPDYSDSRPTVQGALSEEIVKKILLKRKYGRGGESKAHKDLKFFIANNPEIIGLNKSEVLSAVEHLFVSGDLVDILFKPTSPYKLNTVVEIELDNVIPGIHQAIKYRALRCSQLGLDLTNDKVKATVVAWRLNQSEKDLCMKYNIDYFEVKLD